MVVSDVGNALRDILGSWEAPFHARGRDWLQAGALVAGSAIFAPIDDNVDRWIVAHQNDGAWSVLDPVRQGGALYSGKYLAPAVGGLYLVGLVTKSQSLRDGVWGCLASYTSGSVVRNTLLYNVIARTRPDSSKSHPNGYVAPPAKQGDQYDINIHLGSSDWGRHSFPGGHVANIASCAGFLANRFEMGYAEPVVYIVTAGVGIGRIVDRRHWTSDTIIGAIFGYAIGKEIATRSLHRKERAAGSTGSRDGLMEGLYMAPGRDGLQLGWQRTF
jgi:membrane-associated phospholipid phosphatase